MGSFPAAGGSPRGMIAFPGSEREPGSWPGEVDPFPTVLSGPNAYVRGDGLAWSLVGSRFARWGALDGSIIGRLALRTIA